MSDQSEADPLDLAEEADEQTANVEPDDEGGLGDIDEHRGRGIEEDPGED
jgi:hypothetical protein